MTSELSNFTARLRELIRRGTEPSARTADDTGNLAMGWSGAIFNDLALELFGLQFVHNAPYRKLCESRGVAPDSIVHWKEIPAVPTAAFKELELTCLLPGERTRVFHSSGTTGQKPSRHFHSADSLAVYETSLWAWFRANLRFTTYDLRLLALTPPPSQAPNSSLVYMLDVVRRKLGAEESVFLGRVGEDGAWTLDFEAALDAIRNTQNASLLLGTAFSFVQLLDSLAERDLRFALPPGTMVMETGGYKGRSRSLPKAELHALITERLGVPTSHIICEYGMSELSSQAYDRALDATRNTQHEARTFRFPLWARVQIVSPETGHEVADGEAGLIRVFDLANVFSVMAVQTEDLGIRRGDGFELIGRASLAEARGCSLMTA